MRRYVPELRDVPDRYVHRPWEMPDDVAAAARVRRGVDYPHPVVDHGEARRRALDVLGRHKHRALDVYGKGAGRGQDGVAAPA